LLKFQFDRACFQGGEVSADLVGKWNKKNKDRVEHHP